MRSHRLLLFLALFAGWLRPEQVITSQVVPLSYVRDMVWDGSRGRLLAVTDTRVVAVDPETGRVEDLFSSGGDRIAISGDGEYLYVGSLYQDIVRRYRIASRALELTMAIGAVNGMAVLPGQPQSLIVARKHRKTLDIYDGAVQRGAGLAIDIRALHVRPSDGAIFGLGVGVMHQFSTSSAGVAIARSMPIDPLFSKAQEPRWRGSLVVDNGGSIFDLDAGAMSGRAAIDRGCGLAPDPSGDSVLAVEKRGSTDAPYVVRYSLETFRAKAMAALSIRNGPQIASTMSDVEIWGTDGIAISDRSYLVLLRVSELEAATPDPAPVPRVDNSGVIRIPLAAKSLVYDASRDLIWASAPGKAGEIGNTVVAIEPGSGRIADSIFAGSEPGQLALAPDASRLFVILEATPAVAIVDLSERRRTRTFTVVQDGMYFTPAALAAVPDRSSAVAVVRFHPSISYASDVAVYEDGLRRPKAIANWAADSLTADQSNFWTALYPGDAPNAFYAANLKLSAGSVGGPRMVARLTVDEQGIALDSRLPLLRAGSSGAISGHLVYEDGKLFTGGGELLTPDGRVLHGTFSLQQSYASFAVPVPFSDRGQVAYVHYSGLRPPPAVTLFDIGSFRPVATYPFQFAAQDVYPLVGAVRAGPGRVAVATTSEVLVIPLDGMPPWPRYSPAPTVEAGSGLESLDFPVNAIDAVPGTSKLIFATPSAAGELGNSIVTYDADQGRLESAVWAGSEPDLIAQTPDGSAVYARLAGETRISRVNLSSGSRDLVFAADPEGGSTQYAIHDMAAGPDGGLAVSYPTGPIVIFDGATPRPVMDLETEGSGAYHQGRYDLEFDGTGTLLYARESEWDSSAFKRCEVSPKGVRWLSNADQLVIGRFKRGRSLLYTARGAVIDAERSRRVGQLALDASMVARDASPVAPDADAGRVFLATAAEIRMHDIETRALLGKIDLPWGVRDLEAVNLVRFGADGLALHLRHRTTGAGTVLIARTGAFQMLSTPEASPQPSLPSTEGVTVVDLAAEDLAYDAARNLIYASIPNREAAQGDRIAAIDPGSGHVTTSWPAGPNPRLLALSGDQTRLSYTAGWVGLNGYSGFSPVSEIIRTLDLASGETGPGFPERPAPRDISYQLASLTTLAGGPHALAAIDYLKTLSGGWVGTYPDSVRIYDDGAARSNAVLPRATGCREAVAGESASRLYCSSGEELWRLAVDQYGVTPIDSFRLIPARRASGPMVFGNGRLYTPTGLVLEPEAKRIVARAPAYGAVALDGNTVYWLEPGNAEPGAATVKLRSFHAATLEAVAERVIRVSTPKAARLIACGGGRLAFCAGNEIYIINP